MSGKNLAEIQLLTDSLSHNIISSVQAELLIKYRYLATAFGRLEPVRDEMVFSLASDGKKLYYSGSYIIKLYKREKSELLRTYLHTVLHCLFLHNFVSEKIEKSKWSLACDAAVENVISSIGGDDTVCMNVQYQNNFITLLKQNIDSLTAEKIYDFLCRNNYSEEKADEIRKNFKRDSHQLWFEKNKKKKEEEVSEENEPSDDQGAQDLAEIINEWQDCCEQLNMDMENFSSKTEGSSVLIQNTKCVRQNKYNYSDFLKKFAVTGEDITVNNEEFDYIYYTYGLEKYKNMPLIEPLEYKESKKISEFVIAIDTSGSVQGELVQKFLDSTYSILMSKENFFNKINIRIIQCDDKIEDEFAVHSKDDFDEFIKNIKFKGFGGTNFCPVFERIAELKASGEFTNLKGVIYFTDGYGKYPSKKPDCETAFIFLDYDSERPKVPPWAMGVVIDEKSL